MFGDIREFISFLERLIVSVVKLLILLAAAVMWVSVAFIFGGIILFSFGVFDIIYLHVIAVIPSIFFLYVLLRTNFIRNRITKSYLLSSILIVPHISIPQYLFTALAIFLGEKYVLCKFVLQCSNYFGNGVATLPGYAALVVAYFPAFSAFLLTAYLLIPNLSSSKDRMLKYFLLIFTSNVLAYSGLFYITTRQRDLNTSYMSDLASVLLFALFVGVILAIPVYFWLKGPLNIFRGYK